MNPIDNRLSWAQIWLSVLFLVGVFAVTIIFETGFAKFGSPDEQKLFERLVHFLEDAALLILYFWFQRIRAGGIPDVPTVTQTATGPDGSKVSVTSPAHLPLPQLPANPTQPASPAAKP